MTLKEQVAALMEQVEEIAKAQAIPDPILKSKGDFFAGIFAAAVGTQGSHAFSDNFLTRLENNAERIWNAYVQITRGDSIKLSEQRVEEAKEATKSVEEKLERALHTINALQATVADLSAAVPAPDDLPEEAAPEDIPEAE